MRTLFHPSRFILLAAVQMLPLTLACYVSLFFIDIAAATSIVVVRTSEGVTIASDSKRTYDNGARTVSACKIHQQGNVLIALSGVTSLEIINFDLAKYAKRAATVSHPLSEVAGEFDRVIDTPLRDVTEKLWRSDPVFPTHLNTWFVQVTFVGFENGQPAMITRKYMPHIVEGKLRRESFQHSCPGDCTGDVGVILMGEFEIIRAKLRENPNLLAQNTVAEAKNLIQMEIEANPTNVGAPIEIVRLTEAGIDWVQDELHCEQ